MRCLKVLFMVSVLALSTGAYALSLDELEQSCQKGWAEGQSDASDKKVYKQFGVEFCSCVATELMAHVKKNSEMSEKIKNEVSETCLYSSLLHETSREFDDDEKVTTKKFVSECTSLASSLADGGKADPDVKSFCKCAAPDVVEAFNDDSVSEDAYTRQVDKIAEECVEKMK